MPKHTHASTRRPDPILAASIGTRLRGIGGRGSSTAALTWFMVLSHSPWDRSKRPTWANNMTLAFDAGVGMGQLEYSLCRLKDAAMLSTTYGERYGARRPVGRILIPHVANPVKILVPNRDQIASLRGACRKVRERPGSLVTLMVGAYVLACASIGRRPTSWTNLAYSQADLRRFVGASKGSTFSRRLNALESANLIRRDGEGIWIAPPSQWSVARGEATFHASEGPRQSWVDRLVEEYEVEHAEPATVVAPEIPAWFDEVHAHAFDPGSWESGVSMAV